MLVVTFHEAGSGLCSLTGKDTDGVSISFEDGTVTNQFLSWKAFRQLLAMKISREKPGARIPVAAVLNGPEAATA